MRARKAFSLTRLAAVVLFVAGATGPADARVMQAATQGAPA